MIIRRRIKAGNFDECFQRVGVITLNLHEYAKSNKPEKYKLPIGKSDAEGGEVAAVITVRLVALLSKLLSIPYQIHSEFRIMSYITLYTCDYVRCLLIIQHVAYTGS